MNVRTEKLVTLAALVSTFCCFVLRASSAQSTNADCRRAKSEFIGACRDGNATERRTRVKEAFAKLPLSFEANQRQTDPRVKFLARGNGYNLFLTSQEAVLTLNRNPAPRARGWGVATLEHIQPARDPETPSPTVLRMRLVGANPAPRVAGVDELAGQSHYFIGDDRQQWRTHIRHYRKVRYERVYPGVDLVYYGKQSQLEYDFVVSPGADPRAIKLSFTGPRRCASALRASCC
jgi:hypothetical protein